MLQQKDAHTRFAELRLVANEVLRRCASAPSTPLVPLPEVLELQLARLAPRLAQDALVSLGT